MDFSKTSMFKSPPPQAVPLLLLQGEVPALGNILQTFQGGCGHRTLQFVEIRAQFIGVDDHIDPRAEVIYQGFTSTGKADKMLAEIIIKT